MKDDEIINRNRAPNPWAAARNASMRNAVGITHFNSAEQKKAYGIFYTLQSFYHSKTVSFIDWRDGGKAKRPKFVAFKFDSPTVTQPGALRSYENQLETDPALKQISKRNKSRFTKRTTTQGITYRAYF
jgi:hypothetical protein